MREKSYDLDPVLAASSGVDVHAEKIRNRSRSIVATPVSKQGGGGVLLSVVVPVYGCDGCIEELCSRARLALIGMGVSFEILLVDDRSPDQSWSKIVAVYEHFPEVKGIRLSRNFGQHIAISAGLAAAKGDYAVVMDCDLQDPPERIPELYSKMQEGFDLVLAKRVSRSHSAGRVFGSKAYFLLMGRLSKGTFDGSFGSFSILSRKVINEFLRFNEKERHYLFVLRWLGFSIGTIEYNHNQRFAGKSSYSLSRLIQHALDGIFFQSTDLLKWIVTLGLAFSFVGIASSLYFIFSYFAHGSSPGWTSLFVAMLMCTGAILVSLGVLGLYVGKIFDQVKERPLYSVDVMLEHDDK
ncbi:glycosyltransferase family 2 protein [Rhizobium hidalgonense]|uniref:Glycosyltransferase family 2 protein n=1 Tax=Rhizobium hidalgonense TaxID=1538159 RepID=A0AAJ2LND6_9HYPH|nr:glycosyltransferase family 2 protein [Rhizobium hidalgonense]MDR9777572.1 glycosyltransferase family 2 protein [Rhizobium hidalgonense]MDR9823903.1 glycosyltransferase family 2 protein [Rhizobium hidalgonense]